MDAVLITILKAMGLEDEAGLLGRRGFFVVPETGLEISPRIYSMEREWADYLDLVHRPLAVDELDAAVEEALGRGLPVCLSVDLYSWPHTPHFGQRRQRHYISIFGVDGADYHVLCPYYGFEGSVPKREVLESYLSSGTRLEGLITLEALSLGTLSVDQVRGVARESCAFMLGSAVPEGMEDVDPDRLGCAGIATFAARLENLIENHDGDLHPLDGLADLSRYLLGVGYARHWLFRLLSSDGAGLLDGEGVRDRWDAVVQAWIAAGKRLAMGLYGRRDRLIVQSLRRVGELADLERVLFTQLRDALDGDDVTAAGGVSQVSPAESPTQSPTQSPRVDLWPERPPYAAPRGPEEQKVADAFADALQVEAVGRDDNFFQLGGDSVRLIRLMAKIREDFGVTLGLHAVFETPSVAELASRLAAEQGLSGAVPSAEVVAEDREDTGDTEDTAAGSGPIPLLPSQEGNLIRPRAFLHHRNVARFFELRREVSDEVLKAALAAVMAHHPALRARFEQRGDRRLQFFEPAGDAPFSIVDLSDLPPSQHRAAMEQEAARIQPGFELERAPLVRFVRFARGPEHRDRLFVLFHHILVDGYSCDLVFDDLGRACEQLERGETVRLPPAKTSFRTWAEHLVAYAASPEITAERETWLAMPFARLRPLPADDPDGRDLYRFVARISRQWDADSTRRLTGPVAASLGVTVGELFAAGLLRALADWSAHDVQAIHEFHHGRTPYFDPRLDVSRTVGYFSYSAPFVVEMPPAGADPLTDVRHVTAHKRRIPRDGLGYSLLRFLHPDPRVRADMKGLSLPQVRLNYRGRVGTSKRDGLLRLSDEHPGPIMPASHPRGSLVLTVRIADDRFHMLWQYSRSRHERSTIEALATRLDDFLGALADPVDEQRGGTLG